ncbi:MAG: orotate phosphoribosyltransferase [Xanthomonadales bacterium]|nr:orotate phosphoribosyltransferase [Xanthomonadales bacterium]MDH4020756.1 orotate phosphoribosyltransferase [Xanthomonadales bacterium]
MQNYKQQFFELAMAQGNLKFGEFTLKSGRISPYFFNAGGFDDGRSLEILSACYAQAILDSELKFDMLFGPAYKGIPLAAGIAIMLNSSHRQNIPFAYNRKEAKDHGEGGSLVGADLHGNVIITDDVISAGTSVRESIQWIRKAGANPCGVAIALDRQERGNGEKSAAQEVTDEFEIPVIAIAGLDDLIEFLESQSVADIDIEAIRRYRNTYGVYAENFTQ